MAWPKISTFPLDKPFERQDPTTALSEIGLRLVANFYSEAPMVIGSATLVCGHLLVTTKHVFNDIVVQQQRAEALEIDAAIAAVQIVSGSEYLIWDVVDGIADPISDLAILRLSTNPGRSHHESPIVWRQPVVNPFPPAIGESVAAFGYRGSTITISTNDDGGNHIDLRDDPIVSVGVVREIFEMRRDQRLPFPCYQVSARFDGGMSGGPVFDERGNFCGLICSSFDGLNTDDGEPVSYVTTLWPMFRLITNFDRGDDFPRGVRYPAIELARGGQISVTDLPRLERLFDTFSR